MASCPPTVEPERILVVDDDDGSRAFVARALSIPGFEVHACCDGAEAVRTAAHLRPSLVLTDLHMPGLDGCAVVRCMRALDPQLPVLVMTGDTSPASLARAQSSGADGLLTKPFESPSMVVDKVRATLDSAERQARASQQQQVAATPVASGGQK